MIRLFILSFILLFYLNLQAYDFNSKSENYIAMDYNSKTILFENNADAKMVPSSMSKLMTLYVVFSKLKSGSIKLTDAYKVSTYAWKKGGSSMFLDPRKKATVSDLIHGLVVVSGNDAAITLAEGIAGTEEDFVQSMNSTAQAIGLTNSHFANATGWPHPDHMMSPRDLLTLSIKIFEDFPEYRYLFSDKSFTYNKIYQPNTNELLWSNVGVDGMKTGSTEEGGFGLALTAKRDDRRIFAVFNGLKSKKERRQEGERLVKYIFNNFGDKKIFSAGQEISSMDVLFGESRKIDIFTNEDVYITYKHGEEEQIKVIASHNDIIKAPVERGQELGCLKIYIPGQELREVPLYAREDIKEASFIKKALYKLKFFF